MAREHDERRKRRTAKRRAALVLDLRRGEVSVAEAARTHGLTVAEVEDWREQFLTGAENALRGQAAAEDGQKDREIKHLKQKVGALVMDVDIGHTLGEGGDQRPPVAAADARRGMEALPTASTRAICRVLGVAHSALYRHHHTAPAPPRVPADADVIAQSRR
jgi:transposase-like protein